MISPEHIEQLRIQFVRMQSQFATVIQEMEAELQRMKDNERVPQEVVSKRDTQIEMLIAYNNRTEDLFTTYRFANFNLQVELMATNRMLWDALKSDKTAFEVLMKDVKKIRATT